MQGKSKRWQKCKAWANLSKILPSFPFRGFPKFDTVFFCPTLNTGDPEDVEVLSE